MTLWIKYARVTNKNWKSKNSRLAPFTVGLGKASRRFSDYEKPKGAYFAQVVSGLSVSPPVGPDFIIKSDLELSLQSLTHAFTNTLHKFLPLQQQSLQTLLDHF